MLLLSCSSRVRLCDPIDGSPPGSLVPESLQARTLEWVAIPFSNAWKWKSSCSVVSDSSRPYGLQPTRLPCPCDFPGKSTGVGCHCLLWTFPVREMQIKTTWAITSHLSEWPSATNLQTINAGKSVEKRKCSCPVGGNVNWYSHYGRQYGESFKINKTTIWPSNPTSRHIPWGNQNWKRHMYPIVCCSTIYNS